MWHTSVSARSARTGHQVHVPALQEREAIRTLRGVGGTREWWFLNPTSGIGHLRVALTPTETEQLPPGCAIHDAGESGPERPRTR